MNDIELGYLAGLIDGEGTVTLNQETKYPNLVCALVSIANSDYRIIDWCKTRLPDGRIQKSTHKSGATRDSYQIIWAGNKCMNVLRLIIPYLISKRAQANLLLELREQEQTVKQSEGVKRFGSRHPCPQRLLDIRMSILSQMRQLNQRGPKRVIKPMVVASSSETPNS